MPELPEVETIRRELEEEVIGLNITDLWWDAPKLLQPTPEEVKAAVIGAKIVGIRRRGKLLVFELSSADTFLLIHLKMTGRLLVAETGENKDSYTHVKFILDQNKELHFADMRKFGFIRLASRGGMEAEWDKLGPEPLDDLTLESFRELLAKSSRKIKILLLDQSKIAGVGNIYANEVLFLAGVHPERGVSTLSGREVDRLFEAVETVLRQSLERRGTTTRDESYVDAYGEQGEYQSQLKVYGREGELCSVCGTEIQKVKLGQRGTYFCPQCQAV